MKPANARRIKAMMSNKKAMSSMKKETMAKEMSEKKKGY